MPPRTSYSAPPCPPGAPSMRGMKVRCATISSQQKAKPGVLMGCRLYSAKPRVLRYLKCGFVWGSGGGVNMCGYIGVLIMGCRLYSARPRVLRYLMCGENQ